MRSARSSASRTLGSSSTTRIRTQRILRFEAENRVRAWRYISPRPASPVRARVRLGPGIEREAAGIAGLRGVPVAHLVLVDLPAQVDLVPLAQRGEVDQPGLEITDEQVELL